jgi:hypothetical protein
MGHSLGGRNTNNADRASTTSDSINAYSFKKYIQIWT